MLECGIEGILHPLNVIGREIIHSVLRCSVLVPLKCTGTLIYLIGVQRDGIVNAQRERPMTSKPI